MAVLVRKPANERITSVSKAYIDLVIHFECSGNIKRFLTAYPDGRGVPTIGIGTTRYLLGKRAGKRVKLGDKITELEAIAEFRAFTDNAVGQVDDYTRDDINQGMFDSLVDFNYNLGVTQFRTSTLLKVINADPTNYAEIEKQFLRWKYDDGVEEAGLLRRCKCRAYLYKHGVNAPNFFQEEKTIVKASKVVRP